MLRVDRGVHAPGGQDAVETDDTDEQAKGTESEGVLPANRSRRRARLRHPRAANWTVRR